MLHLFKTVSAVVLLSVVFTNGAFAQPALQSVSPTAGIQGETLRLTLTGQRFPPGATALRIGGTGAVVNGIRFNGTTILSATVTLSGAPGPRTVSVVTPEGTSNALPFEILPSPLSGSLEGAQIERVVGSPGGWGTLDGRSIDARFVDTSGLWADTQHVYVADAGAHTIRRISIATGDVETLAGSPVEPGFVDGIGSAARLNRPGRIWGDGTYLYFLEHGSCAVRRLHIAGRQVSTFAGAVEDCRSIDGSPEAARLFSPPYYMWGDGMSLFLLEDGPCRSITPHQRLCEPGKVRMVDLATGFVQSVQAPPVLALPGQVANTTRQGSPFWAEGRYLYIVHIDASRARSIGRFSLDSREFVDIFTYPPLTTTHRFGFSSVSWPDGLGAVYFIPEEGRILQKFDAASGAVSDVAQLPEFTFDSPSGLTVSGNDVFVSMGKGAAVHRVRLDTRQAAVFAGLGFSHLEPEKLPAIAPLEAGRGIWSDGTNMYVAEAKNGTIQRVRIDSGETSTFASGFRFPRGVWGDANHLYVTDAGNHVIRKIALATADVTTLAGTPTLTSDFADGRGPEAKFWELWDIWGDETHLYVTDLWTIRRITKATGDVITFAGSHREAGAEDGIGTAARFRAIEGIWGDGANLYVAGSSSCTIRRVMIASREVTTLAGSEFQCGNRDGTGKDARFAGPRGIWGDGANLYITDGRLRKISLSTAAVTTLTNSAQSGIWGDGRHLFLFKDGSVVRTNFDGTEEWQIAGPRLFYSEGLFPPDRFTSARIWSDGRFAYAPSGGAIYQINLASRVVTHLAGAFNESAMRDGRGNRARFRFPTSLWGDGTYLYIADTGNHAIRRLELETAEVVTFAQFDTFRPGSLWGDGIHLYAGDELSHNIERISLRTGEVTTFARGFQFPSALWGDDRFLYVGDGCSVKRIELRTAQVSTFIGTPASCGHADGAAADVRLQQVEGIWGNGTTLFVSVPNTLRAVDLATGRTTTISGHPFIFGTENGPLMAARYMGGRSLWGDGSGLYISDHGIRRLSPAASTLTLNFERGAAKLVRVGGLSESLTVGHGRLHAAGGMPAGAVAIFAHRQSGVLISETSVPGAALMREGRLYAEVGGAVNTGIAMANPNDVPAIVSFYFTDSMGANFGAASLTIAANAHIAAFLNEAPFYRPGQGPAPMGLARTLTFSSTQPVAAVALRGFTNERSEFLMTTLPVIPLSGIPGEAATVPHFAAGGGWATQLLLVNPFDHQISGAVRPHDPNGRSLGSYPYAVAPRSSTKIVLPAENAAVASGSIEVAPDPFQQAPAVSTVFSFVERGVTVTESGVAHAGTGREFILFAESGSAQSALAIANSSTSRIDVQFELIDLDGVATGHSGSLSIPQKGQVSSFLRELPGFATVPAAFQGMLRVSTTAPTGFTLVGMRSRINERGDFMMSPLPPAGVTSAVQSELFFPHIVAGAQYTTDFIFLNRDRSGSATLSFFSQGGAPLLLGIR